MPSPFNTVLSDAYEFKFNGLSLQGALISWNDTFAARYGKFEYLKRDGAAHETLGSTAAQFSFQCVYTGRDSSQKYRDLVNTLRKQPTGKLYHPILGQIDAVWMGKKATVNPSQAIDFIDFSLDFEEDQVDATFTNDENQVKSPGKAAGEIKEKNQQLSTSMEKAFGEGDARPPTSNPSFAASYVFNQIILIAKGAQATFSDVADKFSQAALLSAQSSFATPELKTLLGRVQTKLQEFEAKLRATGRTDAELFPSLDAARQTYASCVSLYNAVIAQKPPVVDYVVPGPLSLVQLATRLYGADASTNLPWLQKLNPFLKSASLMPTGAKLAVPSPILRK